MTQLTLINDATINNTISKTTDDYLDLDGDIPISLPDNSLISITRDQPLKIYSIGFQPAKSIPEIPRWFLNKYGAKDFIVVEPFAGSGTTLIECIRFGASTYWLDFHPLSQLICRVKTTPVNLNNVYAQYNLISEKSLKLKTAPSTVDFSNRDFWFQQSVREALEIIKFLIYEIDDMDIRNIFLLALSSTVRKVSNMNDGMILAARRTNVADIPNYSREDTYRYFGYYLKKIIDALKEWQLLLKHKKIIKEVGDDSKNIKGDWVCDAIITSPPYINAIDYVWASKFELHWTGLVTGNQDRLNLSSKEVGTERVQISNKESIRPTGHKDLDGLIKDIDAGTKYKASKGQNSLRARVVYQYFMDMTKHFKQSYERTRGGGYYCFAIGEESTICGVRIPVASILSDFASKVGYKKLFSFNILLKNRKLNIPRNVNWANTIKHDSVIVMQK